MSDTQASDSGVIVTTVAGNDGFQDGTGGPSGTAEFNSPQGIVADALGNVYVADTVNQRIRKIDTSGNVTTLAGNGRAGDVDGTGGPDGTAEFRFPVGLGMDTAGNLYVADYGNNQVRVIDAAGNVTTLAGTGARGYADGMAGPGSTVMFAAPSDVAVDANGNVYVADYGNTRIRKIDPAGRVTTVAGNGTAGFADGTGGPNGTAEFEDIFGIAVGPRGLVYVSDAGNERIRVIDPDGNVRTLAGNGTQGSTDGPGGKAEFNLPRGLAVDTQGNVYVADQLNNQVRRIDTQGQVTTLAGTGDMGYVNGPGGPLGSAELAVPAGVAVDASGNVYIADEGNSRIRKVDPGDNVTTLAGNGGNGTTGGWSDGSGGPTGAAQFSGPTGVAVDAQGVLYVADTRNNRIRKIDSSRQVTTIAGDGSRAFRDGAGGPGGVAEFASPGGIAVDPAGNVYVGDLLNERIRKIDPGGHVTTLAGTGTTGWADGTGGAAEFSWPLGLAVDARGTVYVADAGNNRIRKVDPSGEVTTLAGNGNGAGDANAPSGTYYADGSGGPEGTAQFASPSGVAVDEHGNVYVADTQNNRVRRIAPDGSVTTVAGNGQQGSADGPGGPDGTAEFWNPTGIAVDAAGILYVSDRSNEIIRKIDTSGNVTTLAGNGTVGTSDGPGDTAEFDWPMGVAVDGSGLYVADYANNKIRLIVP